MLYTTSQETRPVLSKFGTVVMESNLLGCEYGFMVQCFGDYLRPHHQMFNISDSCHLYNPYCSVGHFTHLLVFTSFPVGTRGSLTTRVKRQEREADHLPPFSAEVKNDGAVPPLPHTSSWRGV
jgi:hypothetical protein